MIGTDMRSAFKPVDAIVLSGVSPGTKSHHNQHTLSRFHRTTASLLSLQRRCFESDATLTHWTSRQVFYNPHSLKPVSNN